MLLNLKALNESLEKKYDLNRPQRLQEAFSDSMPDWLSKRILVSKYTRTGNNKTYYNLNQPSADKKLNNLEPYTDRRPTYNRPKGEERRKDQTLFGKFLEKGINMDTVKIIETDVPTKSNDPILKEPNIPIFLLSNGQVYAKGLNENEEYRDDPSHAPFKYQSMKKLLSNSVKFAYIDGNDDTNFSIPQKRADRAIRRDELSKIDNYNREPRKAGQRAYYQGQLEYDKSGYRVVPTIKKYRKELAEIKCDKIYDVLKEQEDYLNSVKEEIANVLMNTDIKNDMYTQGNGSDYDNIFNSDIYDSFLAAVQCLRRVEEDLKRVFDGDWTDERKRNYIINDIINYRYSNYNYLMDNINDLKKDSATVFNSIIDWI